jgi:hypothetical protein
MKEGTTNPEVEAIKNLVGWNLLFSLLLEENEDSSKDGFE